MMMSRMDEEVPASEGPVIDHEPATETAAPARRGLLKRLLYPLLAVLVIVAAALGGAWAYTASGLDIFSSANSDRIAALETRISQVEQKLAEQAAQGQAIADRVDGLGQAVEARSGDSARISAIETTQAALAKSLEALQARPSGSAEAAPEAVAQLQAELRALEQKVSVGAAASAELAAEREALARDLETVVKDLRASAPQPAPDGSWSGWAMAKLSQFYTIRPAGNGLADTLENLAKAQDIAGAAKLIAAQNPVPPVLNDWLARAQSHLAKAGAP